eukprot:217299_1
MALCKAISFRFLDAQLTKPERNHFLFKLQDINANIIGNALFHYIMHLSPNNLSDADNMNDLMSNIILSRKKEQNKNDVVFANSSQIKLDRIPKRLVGEISSFLHSLDYINLSKTNRFMYMGCNSPNKLQELQLTNIFHYSGINLQLYPSIRHLALNLQRFNQLMPQITRVPVLNELQSLQLDAAWQPDCDIDMFLNHNRINTNNVTQLICSHFHRRIPIAKLLEILTKFSNIQYFGVRGIQHVIDIRILKQTFTNLKGIALSKIDNSHLPWLKSLIDTFGSNLDYLYLSFKNSNVVCDNFGNVNFSKLEELWLSEVPFKITMNILKTTNNLKQTHIVNGNILHLIESKQMITRLVSSNKSLEHVAIRLKHYHLESMIQGMEDALFQTKQWKRNKFQIMLTFDVCDSQFDPAQYKVPIQKLIFWLKLQVTNFVFILSFANLDSEMDVSTMLGNHLISSDDHDIELLRNKRTQFVIRNIGCNICGLGLKCRRWKMHYY